MRGQTPLGVCVCVCVSRGCDGSQASTTLRTDYEKRDRERRPCAKPQVGGPACCVVLSSFDVFSLLNKGVRCPSFLIAHEETDRRRYFRVTFPSSRCLGEVASLLSQSHGAAMRLDQIRSCIVAAISVGVPVYNQGDPQGCYDVYAKAAHSADTYVPGPPYCTRTGYAWAPAQRSVSARGTGQLVRHGAYAAHVPASGVPCVPRTVWCTTGGAGVPRVLEHASSVRPDADDSQRAQRRHRGLRGPERADAGPCLLRH